MSLLTSIPANIRARLTARIATETGWTSDAIEKKASDSLVVAMLCADSDCVPMSPGADDVDKDMLAQYSAERMKESSFIPLRLVGEAVVVATPKPWNLQIRDEVARVSGGLSVLMVYCDEQVLSHLFNAHNIKKETISTSGFEKEDDGDAAGPRAWEIDEARDQSLPTARRILAQLFRRCVDNSYADLHLQPVSDGGYEFRAKMGNNQIATIDKIGDAKLAQAVELSIYDLSGGMMNKERSRAPQDGEIMVIYNQRRIEMRLASIPCYLGGMHGPCKMTIRFQDSAKNSSVMLENMGLAEETVEFIKRSISQPGSLSVVSGPTGSGKTTTLGACLRYLNTPSRMLYSIENPPENFIPGVNHIAVRASSEELKGKNAGGSFAEVLRNLMRQAPDVIMVGEVRDDETALVMVNAALTGHSVLTTLHANFAYLIPDRLRNMGIRGVDITSTLKLCSSQRLLSLLCPDCAEPVADMERFLRENRLPIEWLDDTGLQLRRHHVGGCSHCGHTGYRPRRRAIFEFIPVTDDFARQVNNNADALTLKHFIREHMPEVRLMWHQALDAVRAGETDIEAVRKVLAED